MGEAIELLRFLTLSATVHADAVQCLVDDTNSALLQMSLDSERLESLEEKLSILLEEQRRLHVMQDALHRSRSARSGEFYTGNPQGLKGIRNKGENSPIQSFSTVKATSGIKNVLRFASSAMADEDFSLLTSTTKRKTTTMAKNSWKSTVSKREERENNQLQKEHQLHKKEEEEEEEEKDEVNIDIEVEKIKAEISQLESMSIKTKLRELESLKQEVKNIDADDIMRKYVGSFHFSHEVEELWNESSFLNNSNIDLFISRSC